MSVELKGRRLLVVGAGGFIGGFIAAEGLRRGMEVTAAVRSTTSRRYLTDPRLRFVTLDYDDPSQLRQALGEAGPWDFVIHNLGATKAVNFLEFNQVNFDYLRRVVEALKQLDMTPEGFLYMSSLSALGKGDEKNFAPLSASTVPNPDTRYGLSKIKAEQYLQHIAGIPYVILRPTGVYGPHERDYLMMIQSIDRHFDFSVGFKTQMLTFIYVDDLVRAMFTALESGVSDKTYIIAEDRAYTQREFRQIVADALGRRWVVPVKLPLWAVWGVSWVAERLGRLRLKASTLNTDKFRIMAQRNWKADTSDALHDLGFRAEIDLEEGIARTVAAYRAEKRHRGGKANKPTSK